MVPALHITLPSVITISLTCVSYLVTSLNTHSESTMLPTGEILKSHSPATL